MSKLHDERIQKIELDQGGARSRSATRSMASEPENAVLTLQHALGNRATRDLLGQRGSERGRTGSTVRAFGSPSAAPPIVQRKAAGGGGGEGMSATEDAPSRGVDGLAAMAAITGADVSDVQIHTNSPPAVSMGALAYTQGNDIHFAPGRFNPHTHAGRTLLGHELAHVAQQQAGRVAATWRVEGMPLNSSPALEREADEIGERAASATSDIGAGWAYSTRRGSRGSGVVQGRFGMEFETTVRVRHAGGARLAYHDTVFSAASGHWEITVDDPQEDGTGVLELTTTPLVDEAHLSRAMAEMRLFVDKAKEMTSKDGLVRVQAIVQAAGLEGNADAQLEIGGAGYDAAQFAAKPQMTMGVQLGNVPLMMREARRFTLDEWRAQSASAMVDTLDTDPTRDTLHYSQRADTDPLIDVAKWGADLKATYKNIPAAEIDALTGFTALVLRYLNEGRYKPTAMGAPPYAKAYFPIMARTDFNSMYEALPKRVRDLQVFTPDTVLNLWGYKDIRKFQREDNPVLNTGYGDEKAGIERGPHAYLWLQSIIDPRNPAVATREQKKDDTTLQQHFDQSAPPSDLFTKPVASKDLLSRGKVAYNSDSMGRMKMDGNLAVLEFRSFPVDQGLDPKHWSHLASRLFAFAARTAPGSLKGGDEKSDAPVMRLDEVALNVQLRIAELLQGTKDAELRSALQELEQRTLSGLPELDTTKIGPFFREFNAALSKILGERGGLDAMAGEETPYVQLEQGASGLAAANDAMDEKAYKELATPLLDFMQSTLRSLKEHKELKGDANAVWKETSAGLESVKQRATFKDKARALARVAEAFGESLVPLRAKLLAAQGKAQVETGDRPDQSKVKGDGNCLFASVSFMVLGNLDATAQLRALAAEEVRAHPLQYVDRLVGNPRADDVMVEMAQAAGFIATDQQWDAEFGEIAIFALANAMRRRICVYNFNGTLRTVVGLYNDNRSINLFYNGGQNHYVPAKYHLDAKRD